MLNHDELSALSVARDTIRRGWCQKASCLDDEGRTVPFGSERAACYCLIAAVCQGVRQYPEADGTNIHRALAAHLPAHLPAEDFLTDPAERCIRWNDADGRTQADVLALIDAALAAERVAA